MEFQRIHDPSELKLLELRASILLPMGILVGPAAKSLTGLCGSHCPFVVLDLVSTPAAADDLERSETLRDNMRSACRNSNEAVPFLFVIFIRSLAISGPAGFVLLVFLVSLTLHKHDMVEGCSEQFCLRMLLQEIGSCFCA